MSVSLNPYGAVFIGLSRSNPTHLGRFNTVSRIFAPILGSQFDNSDMGVSHILATAMLGTTTTFATLYAANSLKETNVYRSTRLFFKKGEMANGRQSFYDNAYTIDIPAKVNTTGTFNWIAHPTDNHPLRRGHLLGLADFAEPVCSKDSVLAKQARELHQNRQAAKTFGVPPTSQKVLRFASFGATSATSPVVAPVWSGLPLRTYALDSDSLTSVISQSFRIFTRFQDGSESFGMLYLAYIIVAALVSVILEKRAARLPTRQHRRSCIRRRAYSFLDVARQRMGRIRLSINLVNSKGKFTRRDFVLIDDSVDPKARYEAAIAWRRPLRYVKIRRRDYRFWDPGESVALAVVQEISKGHILGLEKVLSTADFFVEATLLIVFGVFLILVISLPLIVLGVDVSELVAEFVGLLLIKTTSVVVPVATELPVVEPSRFPEE